MAKNHQTDNPLFKALQKKYEAEIAHASATLIIYFDNQNLNLVGWSTIDIYQNKVETKLTVVQKNIQIDENIFDIRNYTN